MICVLTALASEAQPIVERFGMKPREGAFRWYRSEEAALVVSGLGKVAAGAATAYLHAALGEPPSPVWVNAGVAGHGERSVGEALRAHTVTEAGSARRWYPTLLGGPELSAVEVVTVETPESRFERDAAYDMEAAGFYPTALRFSTTELVQVVKIVSDNREAPWKELEASSLRGLVAGGLASLESLVAHLAELRGDVAALGLPAAELDAFCERWRLTTSERRKLNRLLSRWRALSPDAPREPSCFDGVSGSKELLARVEEAVRRAAVERPI